MKYNKVKIREMITKVDSLILEAILQEERYAGILDNIHPEYKKSAYNLIHYLALRKSDLHNLQVELGQLGLSRLARAEMHVLASLNNCRKLLSLLSGQQAEAGKRPPVTVKGSETMIRRNNMALFGAKPRGRRVRIMVTLPDTAESDYSLVYRLVASGMNVARINCAQGSPESWKTIIQYVRRANQSLGRHCRIAMDLGGPKLRTGTMKPGPQVIYFKPDRDVVGSVVHPARLWLAPPKSIPPAGADAFIPVAAEWLSKAKKGDRIIFQDARGKDRVIEIVKKKGKGRWGHCYDSAYITPGTALRLEKQKDTTDEAGIVGELLTVEKRILLKPGDVLIVHKEPKEGEQAIVDADGKVIQHAHISCTLPEIFRDIKTGEPALFDDGKIEGTIISADEHEFHVRITSSGSGTKKLRANKGINLPDSRLTIKGLTSKDREDLAFIATHADIVAVSFVNRKEDIAELIEELKTCGTNIGIIIKVETKQGFINLPDILLHAMQWHPVGVMIARGDLAVECGWLEMAKIQEEILWLCSAAHIPDVWATQVLENLAKKGTPSRAEITDAAMSQRAECVMLNKGPHIEKAIDMLHDILSGMQVYQVKNAPFLPAMFGFNKG